MATQNRHKIDTNAFYLSVSASCRRRSSASDSWQRVAGVWATYMVTGFGASLASLLLLPKTLGGVAGMLGASGVVSLGASGAVFGLFVVSVLARACLTFMHLLVYPVCARVTSCCQLHPKT